MSSSTMEYTSIMDTKSESGSGQKVICTPEVSLYQYKQHSTMDKLSVPEPGVGMTGAPALDVDGAMNPASTDGFQCGFCGKSFLQKNTFQNHLRSHREGEDPYQCDICGKTFAVPARLTRHYRTHTGEKPYQCEYCNKSFSVKENLSVHRRIHTKERPYKCEVCERAFEHSGKLHRHMRIHTGERPHRCQICQKTFIQSGQLVIHMRTHTGEKPYVCKVCNKGFTCSKQLKVHTRTHTGEKPYTCDICGKSFGYNHVLKLHQVAHYGEKVYKCTLCNGTFTSKKSLESHIKTHSEGALPAEPSSPPIVEASGMSPSSLSQTPQNSDKENRESSDSEISTQHSPQNEAPKTPPSPMASMETHHYKSSVVAANVGSSIPGTASSVVKGKNNGLPYPMLPPGVQVHQSPQSGTTFLYVTSKLPVTPSSGSYRGESPTRRHLNQLPLPSSKQPMQFSSPPVQNANSVTAKPFERFGGMMNVGKDPATISAAPQREKMFLTTANIRDKKVLPFLEQFGYGLPKDSAGLINLHQQEHQVISHKVEGFPPTNNNEIAFPENLSVSNGVIGRPAQNDRRSPSTLEYDIRGAREMSPEPFEFQRSAGPSYTPGGVLALALTRGSKAAMQSDHLASTFNRKPQRDAPLSPLRCRSPDYILGPESPTRNSLGSHTPNSTPRSTPTPRLCESPDNSMEDERLRNSSGDDEMNNNNVAGMKRGRTSPSGGPRKRSSLILEKYAQENPPPNTSPDSILSQRLRLSSVIQYAEKCS